MNNGPAIERAVQGLCPQIAKNAADIPIPQDERALWEELTCCILGSQVKNEVAQAATTQLFCECAPWAEENHQFLQEQATKILSRPIYVNGSWIKYRFPRSRARYLAAAAVNVIQNEGSLSKLVERYDNPRKLRETLVERIPGVGYKQASMFLRNIGKTYRLAILDAHVLDFMGIVGLGRRERIKALSKKLYLENERDLGSYADAIGYELGIVDLAIWVVMRTAKAEGYA